MIEHGGNLNDAVRRFKRPRAEWLDLSAGINPQAYPVPVLDPDCWHRLPEPSQQLIDAAAAYYQAPNLIAVAGTQAAIQALPRLRQPCRVVVAAPSYAEHAYQWRQAGHTVLEVDYHRLANALPDCDVMVMCNPNNPTGVTIAPDLLLAWVKQLAARGGWLVVDEAFGDTVPGQSVAPCSDQPGLIVLRSVGKFFGLAGLRLGFVAAQHKLLKPLADFLGPWSVSGPAQQIGTAALVDRRWQALMRTDLLLAGDRLKLLLKKYGITASGGALYQWWPEAQPELFSEHMAELGIWVRCFIQGAVGIRLGLPGHEIDWRRLDAALAAWFLKERA
jgi:cobalamin biosynthetic protein CobC